MENNGLKLIDGSETLLQRIIKFLRTEKDYYLIYKKEYQLKPAVTYGFSIVESIGRTYTSVILAKYSREIRNYLLNEYDVISIESLKLTPVEDKILIDLQMTSVYDTISIKEVIGGNFLYKGH